MEYDVIIIGAGASGLMAAITAARQGSSVLVIEQKDKPGKKILATGNGKCNFTNLNQNPECYRSEDSAFAMRVLSCFNVSQTLQFFKELGILPKERDGYLYPNSEQAASIVAVLMMECNRLKVQFCYEETVKEIIKPYYTIITGSQHKYYGKKVILATGGCASPKLGSDGSGYQLAKSFGHTLIKPLPALVQLKSKSKACKTVSGVRTNVIVAAQVLNKQLAKEQGEVIFTDSGISGIPVMQLSRFVAKALDQGHKVNLTLDFLPGVSAEEVMSLIKHRIEQNPRKTIEEAMIGLLNHKLNYIIILEAKLDPLTLGKSITNLELERLICKIKDYTLPISDTNSFDHAQVSAGGMVTKEIDAYTMESKLMKGLYLVGELVDVDGTCGGYNLQWAWSSGYLAGYHAGNNRGII